MNKLQIYCALRGHVKKSEQRSALYETNTIAKVLMIIGSCMVAVYLMFIAVMLALIANEARRITSPEFIFGLLPFFLVLDIVVRSLAQQTPAQMVKPYLLLPLHKYDCVDAFIISSIITPNNLLWLFLLVPFAVMSVVFSYGIVAAFFLVLCMQLMFVCNSLFYMLCRTLVTHSAWWLLMPLCVYALMFVPWIALDFDAFFETYSSLGVMATESPVLLLLFIFAVLAVMFIINRKVQYHFISAETMTEKDVQLKTISSFSLFDRFGQAGEYLKLEVKGMLRNKNMRQTFFFSVGFVVIIALCNSFTDIYTDDFSSTFWAIYPFTLMSINLVRIMCPEGNYIECLLVRKENVMELLRAKYYFYSVMLLLPLLLMTPTMVMGVYSPLALLAMMAFTAGPAYCMMMQLAVTNCVTMPLNTKLTRKTGMETNYMQVIVEMVALFLPVGVVSVLNAFFSQNVTYLIMLVVELVFISLHKLWIANIYKRMMKRKYKNLEGFITSR